MSEHSWAIIANPVSGQKKARTLAPKLEQSLSESGAPVTLYWTRGRGDAEILARRAIERGATRLLACGGDGTVHEVVNAIMLAGSPPDTALGILPLGRCNDLSAALGWGGPQSVSADALLKGTPRFIDVGCAGGRYFTTVATLGFDSAIAAYVDQGRAPSFFRGTSAYMYGILAQLYSYRDIPVTIQDEKWDFQGPLFLMAIANSSTYGGRLKIAPSAKIDDGMLDICLVPSVSRWEVLKILPRAFSGSHVNHPAVSMRSTKSVGIESEYPTWIWADGEPLTQTPTTIEVLPKSLAVLTP
jgi:diacylglycerol kinase (ATP)